MILSKKLLDDCHAVDLLYKNNYLFHFLDVDDINALLSHKFELYKKYILNKKNRENFQNSTDYEIFLKLAHNINFNFNEYIENTIFNVFINIIPRLSFKIKIGKNSLYICSLIFDREYSDNMRNLLSNAKSSTDLELIISFNTKCLMKNELKNYEKIFSKINFESNNSFSRNMLLSTDEMMSPVTFFDIKNNPHFKLDYTRSFTGMIINSYFNNKSYFNDVKILKKISYDMFVRNILFIDIMYKENNFQELFKIYENEKTLEDQYYENYFKNHDFLKSKQYLNFVKIIKSKISKLNNIMFKNMNRIFSINDNDVKMALSYVRSYDIKYDHIYFSQKYYEDKKNKNNISICEYLDENKEMWLGKIINVLFKLNC